MMRGISSILVAACLAASCGTDSGPPIVISALRVYAPLPGSQNGVAYMTVSNSGAGAITISKVRSPQFERVEMHETVIEDGVSRMRPLAAVDIGSGETAVFESGGRHLMLIGAKPDTVPGSPVTLEIEHSDGLMIVSATLQTRLPGD